MKIEKTECTVTRGPLTLREVIDVHIVLPVLTEYEIDDVIDRKIWHPAMDFVKGKEGVRHCGCSFCEGRCNVQEYRAFHRVDGCNDINEMFLILRCTDTADTITSRCNMRQWDRDGELFSFGEIVKEEL
jgi:hypothetical protein